ncbi:MAG: nucleotidyltransferase, partial [Kiritimatiellaeota bacterium]|nr:nucleotidyltransferase [Kiritimatiellota bacterium]
VAYDLAKTLAEHGTVARGICTVDDSGHLTSIVEHTAIARTPDGKIHSGDTAFPGDTPVSLNFFGFTPHFVEVLQERFIPFLRQHGHESKSEYFMPSVVGEAIAEGVASVRVLRTSAAWVGVTHAADRPAVVAYLASLV